MMTSSEPLRSTSCIVPTKMHPEELISRVSMARAAAGSILVVHESSPARVTELRESLDRLSGLPVDVAEYYKESLKALQVECYRAAIVFAWAGFIYSIGHKLVQGYQAELAVNYPNWKYCSTEELFDSTGEFQVLEAAKKCGLIKNQKLLIYKGWLSLRNQCAHPTLFQPGRNASLGFVDSVVSEVAAFI
jgi:hypothetical protein